MAADEAINGAGAGAHFAATKDGSVSSDADVEAQLLGSSQLSSLPSSQSEPTVLPAATAEQSAKANDVKPARAKAVRKPRQTKASAAKAAEQAAAAKDEAPAPPPSSSSSTTKTVDFVAEPSSQSDAMAPQRVPRAQSAVPAKRARSTASATTNGKGKSRAVNALREEQEAESSEDVALIRAYKRARSEPPVPDELEADGQSPQTPLQQQHNLLLAHLLQSTPQALGIEPRRRQGQVLFIDEEGDDKFVRVIEEDSEWPAVQQMVQRRLQARGRPDQAVQISYSIGGHQITVFDDDDFTAMRSIALQHTPTEPFVLFIAPSKGQSVQVAISNQAGPKSSKVVAQEAVQADTKKAKSDPATAKKTATAKKVNGVKANGSASLSKTAAPSPSPTVNLASSSTAEPSSQASTASGPREQAATSDIPHSSQPKGKAKAATAGASKGAKASNGKASEPSGVSDATKAAPVEKKVPSSKDKAADKAAASATGESANSASSAKPKTVKEKSKAVTSSQQANSASQLVERPGEEGFCKLCWAGKHESSDCPVIKGGEKAIHARYEELKRKGYERNDDESKALSTLLMWLDIHSNKLKEEDERKRREAEEKKKQQQVQQKAKGKSSSGSSATNPSSDDIVTISSQEKGNADTGAKAKTATVAASSAKAPQKRVEVIASDSDTSSDESESSAESSSSSSDSSSSSEDEEEDVRKKTTTAAKANAKAQPTPAPPSQPNAPQTQSPKKNTATVNSPYDSVRLSQLDIKRIHVSNPNATPTQNGKAAQGSQAGKAKVSSSSSSDSSSDDDDDESTDSSDDDEGAKKKTLPSKGKPGPRSSLPANKRAGAANAATKNGATKKKKSRLSELTGHS